MKAKFVSTRKTALAHNTNPRLKGNLIVSPALSIAFLRQEKVKLNQNWSVGFSILEISKFIMQSLMYKAVKPAFGRRVTTLLTDTDSWVLALPAKSEMEVMKKLKHVMDFSNFPSDHKLHDESVKNRTGFLKNEMPTNPIYEVVGVRSKTYAIRSGKSMESRCKGVKEAAKKRIPFEAYKKCVTDFCEQTVMQYSIQSKTHVNRLVKQNKVAFSSFDDKRYLLCGKHSVPYGSVVIKKSKKLGACYICKNPNLFL